jgi:hypothetical protein
MIEIPKQLQNPEFKIKQFEKFYYFLMKNAPEGYQPWFFPCEKNRKNPSPKAILKIDKNSRGSWHHESARLSKEQCIEHIKQNYNIGISARNEDPLIIGDLDSAEVLKQIPKNTLTTISRKRCGGHFFGWDKDGTAKINCPLDDGEMRCRDQYVLAPGSYVPFNLKNPKEVTAFEKLTKEAKEDSLIGYYTVREATAPRELTFDDLPEYFKKDYKTDGEVQIENEQREEKEYKEFTGTGKYSELLKLKMCDIVGAIPHTKRNGHPLHDSDTDANFSLSKDGSIAHCWRHLVSLNAVQYLCVLGGYAKCQDAGTPHQIKGKPKRYSKIKGDKKALEFAYNEAKKLGLIAEQKQGEREILELLEEEEKIWRYLDLGEIEDEFYYGFKIKGREAIITSDGRILRNTLIKTREGDIGENEIKELFEYDSNLGEIAPIISKETIKKYYTKKERNHLINPKEIYKTIRDKILYYMDFSGKDEIADVLTCWIIATYCYPLFYWFPHLLFNAPTQSGKTKGATIVMYLSFRGFDLGASSGVSPAQIFRTLEGNRGTVLIDEFEQMKGNKSSDTQQLVNQLLNASASRDAYVIRNEQINRKWIAKKFPIFSPKISCNISGINPTSLSRYIPFSWLKTSSEKGKRKPTRGKDKQSFKPIQEDLHILMLENFKEIKEIYENLEINLSNREEDNWLPLISIARFIDQLKGENLNVESQLMKYIESYRELSIETGDNTEDFFRILYEFVSDEENYYKPKDIGGYQEIADLFSYLKSPAHKVGKILKSYKFRQTIHSGTKKYLLSKNSIKRIIDLYFNTDITIPNTTNNTKYNKQHQLTPINTQKEISKGLVVLGGISGITPKHRVDKKISENPKKKEVDFPND